MPRFFLHLRHHVDDVLDVDGVELADLDALKREVAAAARDIMAGDVRSGIIDLRYRIDAQDEEGAVVFSLPFRQAVDIIPPP